jgi:Mor family transcriptional regulator
MKPMEARRSELLASVASTAAELALELGLPQEQAEQLGAAVADGLADSWGGQTLYFPIDAAYQLSPRDREILEAHRHGTSVAKLARDHSMSEQGIRKLLRRASLRDRALNQIELFDQAS